MENILENVAVTQSHIDNGVGTDNESCMVALAVRAHNGNILSVNVDYGWIIVSTARDTIFYDTPDSVSDRMTEFDDGEAVAPFIFTAVENTE